MIMSDQHIIFFIIYKYLREYRDHSNTRLAPRYTWCAQIPRSNLWCKPTARAGNSNFIIHIINKSSFSVISLHSSSSSGHREVSAATVRPVTCPRSQSATLRPPSWRFSLAVVSSQPRRPGHPSTIAAQVWPHRPWRVPRIIGQTRRAVVTTTARPRPRDPTVARPVEPSHLDRTTDAAESRFLTSWAVLAWNHLRWELR